MLPNSLPVFLRDAKWGTTLELSSRRFNSDIVGPGNGHHGHANFPPFATPEVPPPPMHLFQGVLSKGKVLPCQVIEVSCRLLWNVQYILYSFVFIHKFA